jgi:hypothetical protein
MNLVFDGGAVTRAHPFDQAGVERATVQAATDDVVRASIGVGDPAGKLPRMLRGAPQEGKHGHGIKVSGLFLAF